MQEEDKEKKEEEDKSYQELRRIFGLPLFVEKSLIIRLNWKCNGTVWEVSYYRDNFGIRRSGSDIDHYEDLYNGTSHQISSIYDIDKKHIGYFIYYLSYIPRLTLPFENKKMEIRCDKLSNALSVLFGTCAFSKKHFQYKFIYEHYNEREEWIGFDVTDRRLFEILDIEKIEFKLSI